MWVAKIKLDSEGTLIGSIAVKTKVDLFGFPISFAEKKEWIIVNVVGTIFGEEKNKSRFISELKKKSRLVNLERTNDFFIATIKEPLKAKDFYQHEIIHLEPVYISAEGFEILTVGSFEKKAIMKTASLFEKDYSGKLLYVKQKEVRNISVMRYNPSLTGRQKDAITLAVKNGYYSVPRKIDVKELAKMSGLSFSTFQVHLRKAEAKLIPFYSH